MEEWERRLDAARRFLSSARMIISESPEAVPLLVHRAVEHMVMALAYYFTPREAGFLNSHGRRRSWLSRVVHDGLLPREMLSIYDELTRIYKRSTYLLENGELACKALELAEKALLITCEKLGRGEAC